MLFNHDSLLISLLKQSELGVGQRIYPERARQRNKSPLPYIVYTIVSEPPYYSHAGRSEQLQNSVIHWFAVANTDTEASAITENLITDFEELIGTQIGDSETQYYIQFVKILDRDSGEYDPKDGSDDYTFYRRLVVEIVWQYA